MLARTLFCALVAATALASASRATAQAVYRDSIPGQAYFAGTASLYRGDYRDAIRSLNSGARGAIQTINARWVDSVCFYAMLGETYYHAGRYQDALAQFDAACSLLLQNRQWLLRVQFEQLTPDPTVARRAAPWGVTGRQAVPARFGNTMAVSQGQFDNSQAVAQGGVVQQLQFWQVNVVEIMRCSALAIRRRNEILGPLAKYDKLSGDMTRLYAGGGGAPPNHWSNAWTSLLRGIAQAGIGDTTQASRSLEAAVLAGGRFDHPLTGLALLEQGRLAMAGGEPLVAESLLAEASFSAFQFSDPAVVDEAFRLIAMNRQAAGARDVSPLWQPAAAWARRDRFEHIAARAQLAAGEELLVVGNHAAAASALKDAQSRMRDARSGQLGIAAGLLDARLQYALGRDSAAAAFNAALAAQSDASLRNFQIALANQMFDAQTLPTRGAQDVYAQMLADPGAADLAFRFLDALAVMKTPHDAAFDRWFAAALERNNVGYLIEVADRAKRRRYHQLLPWGGRIDAMRLATAAPLGSRDPQTAQTRRDLLAGFPDLAAALATEQSLRTQVQQQWLPELELDAKRRQTRLWKEYAAAIGAREQEVAAAALTRVPVDFAFPPRAETAQVQQRLRPGQAILVFHDSPAGLSAMLMTSKTASHWNCGPAGRLGPAVTQLLRALGNYDANREISTDELASDEWHAASDKVFAALFEGARQPPHAIKELVIVPDGVTWYVPFEALWIEGEDRSASWISFTQIRYAPTVGLAVRHEGPWRRVQRTGVVLGSLSPGKTVEEQTDAAEIIRDAVAGAITLDGSLTAPGYVAGSALDGLVVLTDVDATSGGPLDWNPAPLPEDRRGALADWLLLAGTGPQRVVLPGLHTLAETGGRGSRRAGSLAPGDELFAGSCALASAGAETVLLSRWRVGGDSTLQLVHDFLQEAPHSAAADAWQRSVQLAMETPVDPVNELRVRQGKSTEPLTAAHPFFWAGYMVVDTGWRPAEEEDQVEPADVEAPPAAGPVAEGEPPAEPAPADAPAAVPAQGDAVVSETPPAPASE
ncbi:MAG: CHAT domain-containing protein [Pirellulales bacterium]|nr:CHAT domain-containing protein [Pirellulales bacterium]